MEKTEMNAYKNLQSEYFQMAVEASPAGLLLADEHGKIVFVNNKIERIFGYSKNEVLGQKIEMLIPDRYRENHIRHHEGYSATPAVRQIAENKSQVIGMTKANTEFPIEIDLRPIVNEKGNFILASIQDCTQKGTRLEAEDRLASIIESSDDAIISKDLDGLVQTWNQAAERIFGYTSQEMLGKPMAVLIPDDRKFA